MRQEILPEAVAELREAVGYYESRSAAVGRQFADEVRGVFEWIEANLKCPVCGVRGIDE
jgi:hypothetical protein